MQSLEQYFAALFDSEDLLRNWRKREWDRFQELGLPRPKQEAFQYVPLQNLTFPKLAERPASMCIKTVFEHRILFADGFFQNASLPGSLVCLPLHAAMRTYGVFLQNHLARSLKDENDPFAALNGALQGEGAFFYVPPNVRIEEPIEIHECITSSGMLSPHLQIFLGKGASVNLVHGLSCIQSDWNGSPLCNTRIDVALDEGASLFFGDKNRAEELIRFQSYRFTLKRDSRLHFFSDSKGSRLARSSVRVRLLEENSEALIQGVRDLEKTSQSHVHVEVEHAAPHCRSRQHFKGVLREKSRSSFEGKIRVRPIAQKTEAYQLNNNLLLSDFACVYAKPNLEIFADDVKASHGATIAQMPTEELFYLRSRGIGVEEAKHLLMRGFCAELLASAPRFFREF